ncbi:MAG: hypothetical protein ACPGU6_04960 [Tenacibaculum sp.]
MVYRLRNIQNNTIEDLKRKTINDYKFITYQYSISLIIGNIHLFSPVYLLEKDETKKHAFKYNLISFIFGWWSVPYGPTNTIVSIKNNLKGGVDVTKDIMVNLDEKSLENKKVKIETIYSIFKHAKKDIENDFIKSIKKTSGIISNQDIYLAQYTNTNSSYYVIGFEKIPETSINELTKNLRKIFYSHVQIDIFELNKNDELDLKLTELGKKIKY